MPTPPAAQTLFRFVNVRSPQLSDSSDQDLRFIYRPDAVASQPLSINVFDAAVDASDGTNTQQLLLNAATAFKSSSAYLSSDDDVQALVSTSFFGFTEWLARNRDSFVNSDLLANAAGLVSLSTDVLTRLWNTLFYQLITQESFYVKEAIMQVLLANQVISNMDTSGSDA